MDVTEKQKNIYNLHLKTYKQHQQKPYQLRQNFINFDIEKPEEFLWLQKIDRLFTTHPQINPKLFFAAPYQIYEDVDYYNLNYYTSQAAIKAYTVLLKQLNDQLPDSQFQLEFIKDSLEFLKKYCIEKNLELIDYLNTIEQITYMWAVHLAEHKISPYILIGFKYFNISMYDQIFNLPEDERNMLIPEFEINYRKYETKLDQSILAKKLICNGLKIISQVIHQHLTTSKALVR